MAETAAGLAPVGRATVQDRVYTELRRALIGGLFAPGQVLTIRQLSDALMTSTMPVRDALGRLITERALEVLPNRTIRVPPVTLDRIEDLLRVRVLLEGEATALAARRVTPELMATIKSIMTDWDAMRRDARPESVVREAALNQSFHFEIYRACGSTTLLPMIESLWLQSGPFTRAAIVAFSEAGAKDAARFHHDIVRAMEAGNADAARAALVGDISRPFDYLKDKLGKEAA